ncbi:MAG: hypothetical protein R3309_12870 [Reinekea sp.]|nr:hypothetical protein [Reinekea sp.]
MLEKQINDILTNGNAKTAVERLSNLFSSETKRARMIEMELESIVMDRDGVDARNMSARELVEAATTLKGYDIVTLGLMAITGAFVGAVAVYVFGGV